MSVIKSWKLAFFFFFLRRLFPRICSLFSWVLNESMFLLLEAQSRRPSAAAALLFITEWLLFLQFSSASCKALKTMICVDSYNTKIDWDDLHILFVCRRLLAKRKEEERGKKETNEWSFLKMCFTSWFVFVWLSRAGRGSKPSRERHQDVIVRPDRVRSVHDPRTQRRLQGKSTNSNE